MISFPLLVGLTVPILVYALVKCSSRSSLSTIRGPKSSSFIFGNLLELFQRPIGEVDNAWCNLYGNVVRFKGTFGEDHLLIADPKALQKMLNMSYEYLRLPSIRVAARMMNGRGIFWAEGEDHKRHRKVMAPGFGQKETRTFLPIFKECAEAVSTKWLEIIGNDSGQSVVEDARAWLSRATLDSIGQAVFDVQFSTACDGSHPLVKKYKNYFDSLFGLPSAMQIFLHTAHIPTWILDWIIDHGSNARLAHARDVRNVATDFAKELVRDKGDALLKGKGSKDIFTLLVKANMDAEAKSKLSEDEMYAQMCTLLIAGHETTATSISWILLELARNPEVQSRLRDEIRKTKAAIQARGNPQITAADLDAMSYLNAVIKEGSRFRSVAAHVWYMASQDDVLPLSKPIRTECGDLIDEIHVPKGTQIVVSAHAYNHDKDLWGEDAHEFNPERWLDGTTDKKKSSNVGVYSNLMTFSSGSRSCLGWRFSILELQMFLFELVGKFEFGKADKTDRIVPQLAFHWPYPWPPKMATPNERLSDENFGAVLFRDGDGLFPPKKLIHHAAGVFILPDAN